MPATTRTWETMENNEQPQLGSAVCWNTLAAGCEGLSSVSLTLGAVPLRLVGWFLGEWFLPKVALKSALHGHEMILHQLKDALVMKGHHKCCCLAPVGSQAGGGKPGWEQRA